MITEASIWMNLDLFKLQILDFQAILRESPLMHEGLKVSHWLNISCEFWWWKLDQKINQSFEDNFSNTHAFTCTTCIIFARKFNHSIHQFVNIFRQYLKQNSSVWHSVFQKADWLWKYIYRKENCTTKVNKYA